MEDIGSRFEIIQLAVKMGEHDTVKKQVEALRTLEIDDSISEILDLLESKNYRQALYMIKKYTETTEDDFFSDRDENSDDGKDDDDDNVAGISEKKEYHYEQGERVLNLDDLLEMTDDTRGTLEEYNSPDEIGARSGDDIVDDGNDAEGELDIVFGEDGAGESSDEGEEEADTETTDMSERSDIPSNIEGDRIGGGLFTKPGIEHDAEKVSTDGERSDANQVGGDIREDFALANNEMSRKKFGPESNDNDDADTVSKKEIESGDILSSSRKRYPPISYIGQKYKNMINQFPPLESEAPICPEVLNMQKTISERGYSEDDIAKFLKQYQRYKEEGDKDRAAQILLLAAATESKFAQFMLARELFRGDVLQEDHAESFTQINSLADQNFAEAICDLGQFYEHGIGISRDRQMALLLYEEAAEMGVERAKKHYERLGGSKGLFGFLTRFMKKKKKRSSSPS